MITFKLVVTGFYGQALSAELTRCGLTYQIGGCVAPDEQALVLHGDAAERLYKGITRFASPGRVDTGMYLLKDADTCAISFDIQNGNLCGSIERDSHTAISISKGLSESSAIRLLALLNKHLDGQVVCAPQSQEKT